MNFGVPAICLSLLLSLLAGCASRSATPAGTVHETIQRELAQASRPVAKPDQKAIEQALLPPLEGEAQGGKSREARFDLIVQNAPATQVFTAIVSGTPFSMLLGPDVGGNITVNLKNVTVREALDTIRELYGYEYRVQGNRITMQTNALQTRVFQVNYLAGRRQGTTDTRVTSTSITGATAGSISGTTTTPAPASATTATQATLGVSGTGGSRVSTTTDSDFWRDIQQALATIVGSAEGRSVVINPSSGVIVIKAFPLELRNVEAYLKATQIVVERQVMLEAKIIDVSLAEGFQSGVNWAQFGRNDDRYVVGTMGTATSLSVAARNAVGQAITDGSVAILPGATSGIASTVGLGKGFYGLAFQSATFAALLNFLETQGSVHVLSSPRVATLNNQKAVLKVGSDEFFVTNVSTTTTTGTGSTTTSPTVTLQPFFSGIALDVTPQIDQNDQIILHVHPSISTVTEKAKRVDLGTGGVLQLPLAASTINESDSIVRARDGQIVAIGGLMRQSQTSDRSQLPGAGDSPGIGWLFGQRGNTLAKSELVILIKPTIIRDDADWQASQREALDRLKEYAPSRPVVIN